VFYFLFGVLDDVKSLFEVLEIVLILDHSLLVVVDLFVDCVVDFPGDTFHEGGEDDDDDFVGDDEEEHGQGEAAVLEGVVVGDEGPACFC
jgi:hypothetical protein